MPCRSSARSGSELWDCGRGAVDVLSEFSRAGESEFLGVGSRYFCRQFGGIDQTVQESVCVRQPKSLLLDSWGPWRIGNSGADLSDISGAVYQIVRE